MEAAVIGIKPAEIFYCGYNTPETGERTFKLQLVNNKIQETPYINDGVGTIELD